MTVLLSASACTAGGPKKPLFFDSDIAGNKARQAELLNCTPRTETGPTLLDGKLPEYPRRERMTGTVGTVDVVFVVSETGTTTNIETLRATSHRFSSVASGRFSEEVETAVREWVFAPAMDQGTTVPVVCAQQHQFDADGLGLVSVILLQTRPLATDEGSKASQAELPE